MHYIVPVFIIGAFLISMIRVLNEYERGVVFRLGKMYKVKGPGLIILIPLIDKMQKVLKVHFDCAECDNSVRLAFASQNYENMYRKTEQKS